MNFQQRLRQAVDDFGWGPRSGTVAFYRNGCGWQLGNCTVVALWIGAEVPEDPEQALRDIERRNAQFRRNRWK